MTFNIWGIPGTPHKDLRLQAIPKALKEFKADIVAIQELWDPRDVPSFEAALKDVGFPYAKRFDGLTGGGLLIASRFPIQKSAFREFALAGNPKAVQHGDYYAGKGIGAILLKTPFGPLAFINTHVHASYGGSEYEAEQISQLLEISDFLGAPELEKKSSIEWMNEVPIVLVGDINRRWDTLACEMLLGRSHLIAAREKQGIDAVFYRSSGVSKINSLGGAVILGGDVELGDGIRSHLSDHSGVYVDLEFINMKTSTAVEWTGQRSWEQIGQDVVVIVRREVKASQMQRLIDGFATLFFVAMIVFVARSRYERVWLRRGALVLSACLMASFAFFTIHDHNRIQELNSVVRKLFQ
ncbi:MAG: endonuclease/exonuclease/phosphatase family protein [Planctomycetota bacterium]|nr:endonuclease/exonuclease/phosphatase family protein [Planctomycetota bacterium]